ncbi:hypothetical protein ACQPZX_34830 [Actinoplanes sp. CA-142083]|uniref:hypothetical protein n=1 Tax=Actinoplanes sp. CA-142083 TaxID=3239903 RepID=UPI003D90A99F
MLNGAVIVESLRPGAEFEGTQLTLRKLSRVEVADNTAEQPKIWTLVEFSSDADPTELASHLADALSGRGWYASYDTDDETYVIFPGKVFHYSKGDDPAREEVKNYARSAGVPDAQLDW